jgi:hypothetical protein
MSRQVTSATRSTVWTYPVVLVPLIVLALVGWKMTALGLLIPCLLLLLYLNWPPLRSIAKDDQSWYLLDFGQFRPQRGREDWGTEGWGAYMQASNRYYRLADLLPCETWDWSGWYWLWPSQLAVWGDRGLGGPLMWALPLVGVAELLRWVIRRVKKAGTP